jgi:hypothetical protein
MVERDDMGKSPTGRGWPWKLGVALAVTVSLLAGLGTAGATAAACPNEALRTELGWGTLPDCRGYEMVTPSFKEGAAAFTSPEGLSLMARSEDGLHLIIGTSGAFAGTGADHVSNETAGAIYEMTRTASEGWKATPLVPAASAFPSYSYLAPSSNLSESVWQLRASTETEAEGPGSLYLRKSDGTFTLIGPSSPSRPENSATFYLGASHDLKHVLFSQSASDVLWPGDITAGLNKSLYEYDGTNNAEPTLVGVRNEGLLVSDAEAQVISSCGTELGSEGGSADSYNAVSSSGNVVFFTANGGEGCGPTVEEVYARINRDRTVPISEPSKEACAECDTENPKPGMFRGASEDGSKAFFMTEQALLPGAAGMNLYEYDRNAPMGEQVTLVSRDSSEAGVQGVARVSEDGSHVAFVARGVLTADPNAEGRTAQSEEDNLYLLTRDTAHPAGTVTFIATLSPEDETDWKREDTRPVQMTPDGGFLIFLSSADLTPDDTSTAPQLFEYDVATGVLTRISVGRSGFNDDGNTNNPELGATISRQAFEGRFVLQTSPGDPAAMNVSEDGSEVFFTSADNLVPQATPGAHNVYEYRGGNVSLISDGHDASRSEQEGPSTRLLGIDSSGLDVFFTTADPLVGQDGDTQRDIYDARVDGGFQPPAVSEACLGEACRGPLAAPPRLTFAGSMLTPGGENLPPSAPAAAKAVAKPPTRVQKLAKALKACRAKRNRHKRSTCERHARREFGGKVKKSKAAKENRSGR